MTTLRSLRQAWACFRGRHRLVREVAVVTIYAEDGSVRWTEDERTICEACGWEVEG